jgi:hypothetical protein
MGTSGRAQAAWSALGLGNFSALASWEAPNGAAARLRRFADINFLRVEYDDTGAGVIFVFRLGVCPADFETGMPC